VFEHAK